MATYYVSSSGSNTAPYDTWAKAANAIATILATASAGDTCYIAPGRYKESALVPTNSGTLGAGPGYAVSWISYIGDYNESITDGSSQKHGKGTGYILIDASNANGVQQTVYTVTQSNKWAYHRLHYLTFTGGAANLIYPVTSGTTAQVQFLGCNFYGWGASGNFGWGIYMSEWAQDASGNPIGKFTDCIIANYGSDTTYGQAAYVYGKKSTAFNTNPDYTFTNTIFISTHLDNVVYGGGNSSSYYTYITLDHCTVISWRGGVNSVVGIGGANGSYNKVSHDRCAFLAYGTASGGISDLGGSGHIWCICNNANTVTGYTKDSTMPIIGGIPYLLPDSGWVEGTAETTVGTDIFGTSRPVTTYTDAGAQEYTSGQYPLPPMQKLPSAAAGGGSGGLPILKGSVVR